MWITEEYEDFPTVFPVYSTAEPDYSRYTPNEDPQQEPPKSRIRSTIGRHTL